MSKKLYQIPLKLKKSFYQVTITWKEIGTIIVEENTLEEAIKNIEKNLNNLSLPEGECVNNSVKVDKKATKQINQQRKG